MKAERFSITVPQQEVMSLRGLSFLCVLMFPKATPGLDFHCKKCNLQYVGSTNMSTNIISNMSVLPRPNLKLDLEITNLL